MKLSFSFILSIILLLSCSQIVKIADREQYEKIDVTTASGKKQLSLVFSHNLHGETHPCGCRHFPLGGLPQAAGTLNELKNDSIVVYVDTGDTFFPSTTVPASIKKSLVFTAENLAKALDEMGLNYFVPGDQDFAMGINFLKDLSNKYRFKFLVSNLKENSEIKHSKWAKIKLPQYSIYLIGVIDTTILKTEDRDYFVDAKTGIENALNEIKNEDGDAFSKKNQFVLLSHSGMEQDQAWANLFPRLNWIIGAHTQSFTNEPVIAGTTKLVQVLSKNHYMGLINFNFNNDQITFRMIENRDEQKDKLKPNPFSFFLDDHKAKLKLIQKEEEEEIAPVSTSKNSTTFNSCITCHVPQGLFWQGTPHALAFGSLIKAQADKNPACIGCHSLHYKKDEGFTNSKNMVIFKRPMSHEKYFKKYLEQFRNIKSVREATFKERLNISKNLASLDSKSSVSYNYASVQCLNCHDQSNQHPFDNKPTSSSSTRKEKIITNCLNCHTPDQSPEWYKNNKPEKPIINQHYKSISCPKRNEYE